MRSYRLSHRAKADLDDIWDYSQEKWGSHRAAACHRQIRTAIAMIVERPDLGWSDDTVHPGYRRRSVGSHVIFYKIGKVVEIVRVLHQNMDAKTRLG